MPDIGNYLGWMGTATLEDWLQQSDRADTTAFMIGHRGVSLVLVRAGTPLAAQTALLVPSGRQTAAGEISGESGQAAKEQLLIVGLPTMNVQRGDRFKYPASMGRLNYEVIRVEETMVGSIQAYAEEMQ